jgi:hypothetical protein
VLTPVFTLSPTTTPNFVRPVETGVPLTDVCIVSPPWRRLATLVPAPKLTSSPRTLSPTYERCATAVPAPTTLFFISVPCPT